MKPAQDYRACTKDSMPISMAGSLISSSETLSTPLSTTKSNQPNLIMISATERRHWSLELQALPEQSCLTLSLLFQLGRHLILRLNLNGEEGTLRTSSRHSMSCWFLARLGKAWKLTFSDISSTTCLSLALTITLKKVFSRDLGSMDGWILWLCLWQLLFLQQWLCQSTISVQEWSSCISRQNAIE